MYSNARVPDCVTFPEDYAKRAAELGHKIISSVEHGFQGRYIETYEFAKQYDLKFVFGAEAYWVKNRLEKDRTNNHIILLAKNENGRQAINDILSEANISGYYYKPRIDLALIRQLPSDDIIVTSACLAFFGYKEETEQIVKELNDKFKYFFLEVQAHNTPEQVEINKLILEYSSKYKIPLIAGVDSHYISNDVKWERDDFMLSKGIDYGSEHESGWFMDYPDGDTLYQRFIDQKVLTPEQIDEAMHNTQICLKIEDYDSPIFDSENIKMPTIHPEKTQEEKNEILTDLVWKMWEEKKDKFDTNKYNYIEAIQKEIDDVCITNTADYFLLNYEIIREGVSKGGLITPIGRGSAVSFIMTNLLGFSKIDRVAASVKMFPERFMSATRILQSKSMPDLDFNLGNPEVFEESQVKVLGREHAYPMIAYGTYKPKNAWKMYAKAKNVDYELADEVSKQIDKYERAMKYANEEDQENINLLDYVEEKYHQYIKDSERYLGIVESLRRHACAHLLYQGNIRKEIGLIKTKSKSGKEFLCTVMDGDWAEKYKFLKNDLLKVMVVELLLKTYQEVGIECLTERELIEECEKNPKVWDIYKIGATMGINQMEQENTKHKVMKYQPKNESEACAFVAGIRPGFKTMYKIFENREKFEYGIKVLDDLIQTKAFPYSFLLYQENLMEILNFSGIPMTECYGIIKNISRKRENKVKKYKDIFLNGMKEKLEEQGYKNTKKNCNKMWQIINDSSQYIFNASHAYCTAMDSLYGAYLKTIHTEAFYETFLNILDNKKSQTERIGKIIEEATENFNLKLLPIRFGQDNRTFVVSKETKEIFLSLSSIKYLNKKATQELYDIRASKFEYFTDVLIAFNDLAIDSRQIKILIKADYFYNWGNSKYLLKFYEYFDLFKNGKAKQIAVVKAEKMEDVIHQIIKRSSRSTGKTYMDLECRKLLVEIEQYLKYTILEDLMIQEKIQFQKEYLGYVNFCTGEDKDKYRALILEIQPLKTKDKTRIWAYKVEYISIGRGVKNKLTIFSKYFDLHSLSQYDIIKINPNDVRKDVRNGFTNWYLDKYIKE